MVKATKKIRDIIKKVLVKLKLIKGNVSKDFYISKISTTAPWVYISYISDPFYHLDDERNLNFHQNRREAITQVHVLNELGYNVYVHDYLSKNDIPNIKFDIVFGHEPNFVRAANLNLDALKIHYVPGAFIGHRNKQIYDITDAFDKKYNASIPYRRLLEYADQRYSADNAYKLSDDILLIGSKYTVATFPSNIQSKITTIHQSAQQTRINTEIQISSSKNFFFMGSEGNLLKGVSLLIEYFSGHPELTIHFVGPIETDVKEAITPLMADNMRFYGFVDVNSDLMSGIMNKCNFVLYPSGSEGMPGAVLNSMKNGLIPIVTKWSAFDEIDDYGYVIDEWNIESIDKGVNWALSIPQEEILALKRKCSQYVKNTYSLERYEYEFREYMIEKINKYKKGAGRNG